MYNREIKYHIGHQYYSKGKHPRLCTVVDILKTYNHNGDLVHHRYVSTHDFMGQKVTNVDVVEATIDMASLKVSNSIPLKSEESKNV